MIQASLSRNIHIIKLFWSIIFCTKQLKNDVSGCFSETILILDMTLTSTGNQSHRNSSFDAKRRRNSKNVFSRQAIKKTSNVTFHRLPRFLCWPICTSFSVRVILRRNHPCQFLGLSQLHGVRGYSYLQLCVSHWLWLLPLQQWYNLPCCTLMQDVFIGLFRGKPVYWPIKLLLDCPHAT